MKKKFIKSALITLLTSLLFVGIAYAGSTRDWGQLVDFPPVGSVNYYAWISDSLTTNDMPMEIITEDSYNSSDGPNLGYIYYTDSTLTPPFSGPIWRIQARNLNGIAGNKNVSMVFGGIGTSTGSIWNFQFLYTLSPSIKYWETPAAKTSGDACPVRYEAKTVNQVTTVMFYGKPNTPYQIYRSTQGSGSEPDNGLSGGRYQFFAEISTDGNGVGYIIDNDWENIQYGSWYEILYFDPSGITSNGCHSEPVGPTAVEVADFSAVYDREVGAVKFSWQTFSENNLVGFNIYRSESETGVGDTVNDTLIPAAKPGSIDGAIYDAELDPSLWDTEVVNGQVYYYWLEAKKTEGSPIILPKVFTPIYDYAIFVPMIGR